MMAKKGVVILQKEALLPDRWVYSYDGETMKLVEEFDEPPIGIGNNSKQVASDFGFQIDNITDNKMVLELPASQERAVSALTSEIICQAYGLGLISHQLMFIVLEELSRPTLPSLHTIE